MPRVLPRHGIFGWSYDPELEICMPETSSMVSCSASGTTPHPRDHHDGLGREGVVGKEQTGHAVLGRRVGRKVFSFSAGLVPRATVDDTESFAFVHASLEASAFDLDKAHIGEVSGHGPER